MTSVSGLTVAERKQISEDNVAACRQLGLTGRVFVNGIHGFSVVEGTEDMTTKYAQALSVDPRVKTYVQHVDRDITQRELEDYYILIDNEKSASPHKGVQVRTSELMKAALPEVPSAQLKMMIEAYLVPVM